MSDTSSFEEEIDVNGMQSHGSSYLPFDTQSRKSDYSSHKKHELTDRKSSESNCSSPDEKINLVDIESHERNSCSAGKKCTLADTQSLDKGCSPSAVGKRNLLDVQSHENICSSPNIKCNLSDTESPEVDCTSPLEYYYKSYLHSPYTFFSSDEKYHSYDILSSEGKYCASHVKHKFADTEYSDSDSSSQSCAKHLILGESYPSDSSSTSLESVSAQSSDIDCIPPHLRCISNEQPDILLKSANDCEKMLRQIIRTAYQFTRHCHREKLTLKDLEKAFKIHNVDMPPVDDDFMNDKINSDSPEDGKESEPFACVGKWLRKPGDSKLNE